MSCPSLQIDRAQQRLIQCQKTKTKKNQKQNLLADEVSITLLLVVQSLKVLLNLEPDNRRRLVGEVVDQLV